MSRRKAIFWLVDAEIQSALAWLSSFGSAESQFIMVRSEEGLVEKAAHLMGSGKEREFRSKSSVTSTSSTRCHVLKVAPVLLGGMQNFGGHFQIVVPAPFCEYHVFPSVLLGHRYSKKCAGIATRVNAPGKVKGREE